MIVYANWNNNGVYDLEIFRSKDRAADYVIEAINGYVNGDKPKPKKKPARGGYIAYAQQQQPVAAAPFAAVAPAPAVPAAIDIDDVIGEMPNFVGGDINFGTPQLKISIPMSDGPSSEEHKKLVEHLSLAKKEKTFENAIKAIELYEDYKTYVKFDGSVLHSLQEIKVVED